MAALIDYVRYNEVPSLEEANISHQALSIDNIINGPICEVFLKHAAYVALCLYLQHHHHTVGANEAAIKVEGNAHLIGGQAVKDIISLRNKVVPTT